MNAIKYRTPGVYFESIDPAPRKISEVRSDIAGFVGVSSRGPLHRAVKIKSWEQFKTRFGGPSGEGFLASGAFGFFANGGRTCWVVRVGSKPQEDGRASIRFENLAGRELLRVRARDFGPGAQDIRIRIERTARRRFSLIVSIDGQIAETWQNLSLARDDPSDRYAVKVVNGGFETRKGAVRDEEARELLPDFRGSVLIELEDRSQVWESDLQPRKVAGPGLREEGALGEETLGYPVLAGLTLEHFTGENAPPGKVWGLACLESVPEVSLVAMPDLHWPGAEVSPPVSRRRPRCGVLGSAPGPVVERPAELRPALDRDAQRRGQQALIRHCAVLKDRFALLDTPWGLSPDAAIDWANALRSEPAQYSGLYYPWILATETPRRAEPLWLPPSCHVAGMAARVDLSAGVQKPPANERLEEARDVEHGVDGPTHGRLNDAGVNAVLAVPGRGLRVTGAKTLTDRLHPEWRFVNVRRLLIMLEKSIEQAAQAMVFEPYHPDRGREVDRVVRNFLDDAWRRGRLEGETANDAFAVVCDDTINPPDEINLGRLFCMIGVQPPLPAEFIVVRIGRTLDQTGLSGEGRNAHA